MQEKLIIYLREKYSPNVILLHGSRAVSREHAYSDWDIIFLFSNATELTHFREEVYGQNVEVMIEMLPINKEDILKLFDVKLQFAKVLYDESGLGKQLLADAKEVYAHDFDLGTTVSGHKLWMRGRVDGMKGAINSPLIFERYYSQFYIRSLNEWYSIKQHTFSKPVYIALPEIEEKDPLYFSYLEALIISNREEKVKIAEKIIDHLYD